MSPDNIENFENKNPFILPPPIKQEVEEYVGRHRAEPSDLSPENLSSPEEMGQIDEARFSVRALGEYVNPVRAARAYGRFVKRTVKKFGLAEVNGTIGALSGAYLANKYGGDFASSLGLAGAGTVGEGVGFYGTVAAKKYRELRKDTKVPHSRREASAETLRYLYTGFSVAEFVDNPARLAIMGATAELNQESPMPVDPIIAIGVGKLLSDHVYYGAIDPAMKVYEKRAEARKAKKAAKLSNEIG